MNYGLPYKGSKNKLAEKIVDFLPEKEHLIDICCGGCAVAHAALVMNKYKHIHINDVNWMCPTLFIDALKGKYENYNRWVSREDFFRLKDTDPYVAMIWSFGNNMADYLYSRKIEPLKKAIHYAMFFHDYSLGKDLGYDFSFLENYNDTRQKYSAIRKFFSKLSNATCVRGGGEDAIVRFDGAMPYLFSPSQHCYEQVHTERANRDVFIKKEQDSVWRIGDEKADSYRLQHKERQKSMPKFMGEGMLTSSVLDFAEVEIPSNSVIYCDIPYKGTSKYNTSEFDYERFYDWCEKQTEAVYVSSYDMPSDRFVCVEEFAHRSTLCATANKAVVEKLFVPKKQAKWGRKWVQLSLFD